MNDLKPHRHGDEGEGSTHYACPDRLGKNCCGCTRHECEVMIAPHPAMCSQTSEKGWDWEGKFDKQWDECFPTGGDTRYSYQKQVIENLIRKILLAQHSRYVELFTKKILDIEKLDRGGDEDGLNLWGDGHTVTMTRKDYDTLLDGIKKEI